MFLVAAGEHLRMGLLVRHQAAMAAMVKRLLFQV
jgi:hypothetical protein